MNPLYEVTLHKGQVWSAIVGCHKQITLRAQSDSPNVSALFYNADQMLDRYNMPDTLKGQHISKLSVGSCLHSDMGRLLVSIVDSNCDWHDPLCGLSSASQIKKKYGVQTFGEARNEYYHNGRDNMLVELGKHGLGKKDLVPNVNFFSKVVVDESGRMDFQQASKTDDYVSLRTEMNILVVLSNTPHPLAPEGTYPGGPLQISISNTTPPDPKNDTCLLSRPENLRAWENTQDYLFLKGSAS